MEIKLNNKITVVDDNCNVQNIVFNQVGETQKGIAVAVNNKVIQKEYWKSTAIKQNDDIIIIKATQGG